VFVILEPRAEKISLVTAGEKKGELIGKKIEQ
jgi:hypothetical protein